MLDAVNAAFRIVRGNLRSLDLMSITQGEKQFFSVQSLHWGLTSELGTTNSWSNTLRIAYNLNYHSATLEYLLPEEEPAFSFCSWKEGCLRCQVSPSPAPDSTELESSAQWHCLEGNFVLVTACNVTRISSDICAAPFAHLQDGLIDLVVVQECTRTQLLSLMSSLDSGSFVNTASFNTSPFVKYLRV